MWTRCVIALAVLACAQGKQNAAPSKSDGADAAKAESAHGSVKPFAGRGIFCPADAKKCPDGSYVGREPVGGKCVFTPCPEPLDCSTLMPQAKDCGEGGIVVHRSSDPKDKCAFPPCPDPGTNPTCPAKCAKMSDGCTECRCDAKTGFKMCARKDGCVPRGDLRCVAFFDGSGSGDYNCRTKERWTKEKTEWCCRKYEGLPQCRKAERCPPGLINGCKPPALREWADKGFDPRVCKSVPVDDAAECGTCMVQCEEDEVPVPEAVLTRAKELFEQRPLEERPEARKFLMDEVRRATEMVEEKPGNFSKASLKQTAQQLAGVAESVANSSDPADMSDVVRASSRLMKDEVLRDIRKRVPNKVERKELAKELTREARLVRLHAARAVAMRDSKESTFGDANATDGAFVRVQRYEKPQQRQLLPIGTFKFELPPLQQFYGRKLQNVLHCNPPVSGAALGSEVVQAGKDKPAVARKVRSDVCGLSLTDEEESDVLASEVKLRNLPQPVIIDIHVNPQDEEEVITESQALTCAWWNEEEGDWSTSGCVRDGPVGQFGDGVVRCKCNHLTEFAVIEETPVQPFDGGSITQMARLGPAVWETVNADFICQGHSDDGWEACVVDESCAWDEGVCRLGAPSFVEAVLRFAKHENATVYEYERGDAAALGFFGDRWANCSQYEDMGACAADDQCSVWQIDIGTTTCGVDPDAVRHMEQQLLDLERGTNFADLVQETIHCFDKQDTCEQYADMGCAIDDEGLCNRQHSDRLQSEALRFAQECRTRSFEECHSPQFDVLKSQCWWNEGECTPNPFPAVLPGTWGDVMGLYGLRDMCMLQSPGGECGPSCTVAPPDFPPELRGKCVPGGFHGFVFRNQIQFTLTSCSANPPTEACHDVRGTNPHRYNSTSPGSPCRIGRDETGAETCSANVFRFSPHFKPYDPTAATDPSDDGHDGDGSVGFPLSLFNEGENASVGALVYSDHTDKFDHEDPHSLYNMRAAWYGGAPAVHARLGGDGRLCTTDESGALTRSMHVHGGEERFVPGNQVGWITHWQAASAASAATARPCHRDGPFRWHLNAAGEMCAERDGDGFTLCLSPGQHNGDEMALQPPGHSANYHFKPYMGDGPHGGSPAVVWEPQTCSSSHGVDEGHVRIDMEAFVSGQVPMADVSRALQEGQKLCFCVGDGAGAPEPCPALPAALPACECGVEHKPMPDRPHCTMAVCLPCGPNRATLHGDSFVGRVSQHLPSDLHDSPVLRAFELSGDAWRLCTKQALTHAACIDTPECALTHDGDEGSEGSSHGDGSYGGSHEASYGGSHGSHGGPHDSEARLRCDVSSNYTQGVLDGLGITTPAQLAQLFALFDFAGDCDEIHDPQACRGAPNCAVYQDLATGSTEGWPMCLVSPETIAQTLQTPAGSAGDDQGYGSHGANDQGHDHGHGQYGSHDDNNEGHVHGEYGSHGNQ